jgi:hypothetical protein
MKARVVLSILTLVGTCAFAETLKPKAVEAWDAYVRQAEAGMGSELKATEAERALMREGFVYIRRMDTGNSPGPAMIHRWLGGIFIPGARIKPLQAWMQDYDSHAKYFWDIERAKLLSHEADTFKIYYRFRRTKIITVRYNTEHTVEYSPVDGNRATSRSVATRIAELENAGSPNEREKPVGDDSGFLWRLNSYWRFLETPAGVFLECESLSLSRSIPTGLGWLIKGYVESVPQESLRSTLTSIQKGFTQAGSR